MRKATLASILRKSRPRRPVMPQPGGRATALHRRHRMVHQVLHEHAGSILFTSRNFSRCRGLIAGHGAEVVPALGSPSLSLGMSECAAHSCWIPSPAYLPPCSRRDRPLVGDRDLSPQGAHKGERGPMSCRAESQRRTNGGDVTEPRRDPLWPQPGGCLMPNELFAIRCGPGREAQRLLDQAQY